MLITGANRGLGLVCCEALKDEYEIIPFTRKELDFTDPKLTWNFSTEPKGLVGSTPLDIDIVIHCAGGGLGLKGPLLTPQALWQLFMVNLGGIEINRMLIPRMMAEGYGRIIHVCSIASGEAVGSVGYNTIKAALGAYVRSLGRELAPYGVVVSGIAPGGFQCKGNAMERLLERNPEAYADFIQTRLPRGKMGEATELIPLLRYLVSPEASMMGGCVVPIDAGEGHYY